MVGGVNDIATIPDHFEFDRLKSVADGGDVLFENIALIAHFQWNLRGRTER